MIFQIFFTIYDDYEFVEWSSKYFWKNLIKSSHKDMNN